MTATEQAISAYSAQAFVAATDILPIETAGGVGYKVAGSALVAQRTAGGPYTGTGYVVLTSDGANAQHEFKDSGGTSRAYIGTSGAIGSAATNALRIRGDAGIALGVAGTLGLFIDTSNVTRPGSDNVYSIGTASFRWSIVYAATGTINTSDEREKVWRGGLTDAELRAARRIVGELGFYQWADAVAEKGDGARYHFGARAQRVWSIMADEGLVDPITNDLPGVTPYAFLCFDAWEAVAEQRDEEGNITAPARPAGNRFGLRVDQLTLFLIAAQEQRLVALEAGQ